MPEDLVQWAVRRAGHQCPKVPQVSVDHGSQSHEAKSLAATCSRYPRCPCYARSQIAAWPCSRCRPGNGSSKLVAEAASSCQCWPKLSANPARSSDWIERLRSSSKRDNELTKRNGSRSTRVTPTPCHTPSSHSTPHTVIVF